MIKSQLIRLNNKLNRKRIDYIEIQGTCDKNGKINEQFIEIIKYNDEYDYYITLTSGQFSSLFPNIVKDKNDKFYCLENDVLKIITFTKGAYEVTNINTNLQLTIPNESIKLVIDQGSARCKIFLKQGYKIDLHFRDILGFDVVEVDQPLTESPKICDLVISTNIYVHLYIAR